jgi:DNA-binding transcriptional MerR regulator
MFILPKANPAMPRTPQDRPLTGSAAGTSHATGELTTRESWTDWFPNAEPTLTIEEVVAALRERGVDDITVSNIRAWQRDLVLPAPLRRQIGTGRGGVHALYPREAIGAIAQVRAFQRDGHTLEEINPKLRSWTRTIPQTAAIGTVNHTRTVPQTAAISIDDTESEQFTIDVLDHDLRDAVAAAAEREQQRGGTPIREVRVTFTDTRDKRRTYVFPFVTD